MEELKIGWKAWDVMGECERQYKIDKIAAVAWKMLPLIDSGKYWLIKLGKWAAANDDEGDIIAAMAQAEQTARLADEQKRTADAMGRIADAIEGASEATELNASLKIWGSKD